MYFNHMCLRFPSYCYSYAGQLWMDPGSKEVEDHNIEVLKDVVTRYDVDGILFDDYFYPYPDEFHTHFPDNDTYSDYLNSGGSLALDDWRRENVNRFIQRVYNEIKAIKPSVAFIVSPFGLYRAGEPGGQPSSVIGFDPYSELYADAKLWLQQGWLDGFSPQIYWERDGDQPYEVILDWWLSVNTLNRNVYASLAAYKVKDRGWPISELEIEVDISRNATNRPRGSLGFIMFSAEDFVDNYENLADEMAGMCSTPAAIPSYPWIP